jgi:hypothetical protein
MIGILAPSLPWFLAVAITVVPAPRPQDPPANAKTGPEPGQTTDRADELRRLNDKLDDLAKAIRRLEDIRSAQDAQAEKLKDLAVQEAKTRSELIILGDRIKALEEELARVKSGNTEVRRSGFGPTAPLPRPEGGLIPITTTGTLSLVNAYVFPMTIRVDGVLYSLQPGEVRTLTRSTGAFTYDVPGVQGTVARTLVAGETFTIRIGVR